MDEYVSDEARLLAKIDERLERLERKLDQWEKLASVFMTGPGKKLAKVMGLL